MSLSYQILGGPGRDNAAFVKIDTGTSIYRILFDCGENLLKEIPLQDVKQIDYLFFSHLHIDHIAGFDYFFRRNYDREKPMYIFGPDDTSGIIHHRLRGFTWNLIHDVAGEWHVTDITEKEKISHCFYTNEGFKRKHFVNQNVFKGRVIDNKDFYIDCTLLDHKVPSAAYRITEKDSVNINKEKLVEAGLEPGQWLEMVKDVSINGKKRVEFGEKHFTLSHLRKLLVEYTKGESLGYMTDFIYNNNARTKGVELIRNCETVICESQYHFRDEKFATMNYHLTSVQSAQIAKEANAGKLILFHVSDRYKSDDYLLILDYAKQIFHNSEFPEGWLNLLKKR